MSYDFWVEVDAGGPEPMRADPCFSDVLPGLSTDGIAGTVMKVGDGYMRAGNYTSNVSPIWARCLTGSDHPARWWVTGHRMKMVDERWVRAHPSDKDRICLADLDGKDCEYLAPALAAAVKWGIEHLAELQELNPDNGWGNAEGAITYLWDIQRLCEAHPAATLRFSC
jgi:hypothetical protein